MLGSHGQTHPKKKFSVEPLWLNRGSGRVLFDCKVMLIGAPVQQSWSFDPVYGKHDTEFQSSDRYFFKIRPLNRNENTPVNKGSNIPHHPGCTTNLPLDNAQFTLSVPGELATTWVTRSSTMFVQTAPNCSAVCHRGCKWGLASPTGKTRLKTIRQPARIFRCSDARMLRTSASLRLGCEKKLWWILSMTYFSEWEPRQYNQSWHISSNVEKNTSYR